MAACSKRADDAPANANAPAPSAAPATAAAPPAGVKAVDANQQATMKLNAYTDSYNKLIGTFGLIGARTDYFEKTSPGALWQTEFPSLTAGPKVHWTRLKQGVSYQQQVRRHSIRRLIR